MPKPKVLSHVIKGNRVKYVTDNPSRPEFVYFVDEFPDLDAVKKEIERSVNMEEKRNGRKNSRKDAVLNALNARN